MIYKVNNSTIIVSNLSDFNPKHILECGQVFRFKKLVSGYEVYSLNHKATIYCQKGVCYINCDNVKYFINYFDLNTKYDKIKLQLSSDIMLSDAIKYGYGIRILKQSPLETLISFIISSNNNIPRIKMTIEKLCEIAGTYNNGYYAFPTLSQLKLVSENTFQQIGCGYRSKYLVNTIQMLFNGEIDLDAVYIMDYSTGAKYLQKLSGVGPKVADCVLLFAYSKTSSFPTDTWIKKVYYDYNQNQNKNLVNVNKMATFFNNKFGDNSGYAQQYLFYYKRDNKEKKI